MGRKKKAKNKLKNVNYTKLAVLVILFGIIILAVFSPEALSQIEDKFGIKISNVIDYNVNEVEAYNKVSVETITTNALNIEENKLNVFFLDVGQADASLLVYKDKSILIDSGNVSDGKKVVDAIKGLGIKKLDYVFGTHIHEDHIGSMSYVVENLEIGKIYLPFNDSSTTKYYKNLLKAIQTKNMGIEEAVVGDKINISDDFVLEIMAVDNTMPEDENDASIVVLADFNESEILFMGDATTLVEEQRTWPDIDVLRVGHHGSNTSSSYKFLQETKPEISIISVGEDNSYGLPKDKIIKRLNEAKTNIYRTDKVGTIQFVTDGNDYKIIEIDISFDGS